MAETSLKILVPGGCITICSYYIALLRHYIPFIDNRQRKLAELYISIPCETEFVLTLKIDELKIINCNTS
jgi:hypothetical protein